MGQKVKPRTYRLGVPYDKTTLLMTVESRVPTKDRMGHKSFVGFSKHSQDYAHHVNRNRRLSTHRDEVRRSLGLLSNRMQTQVRQDRLRVKVEVYQPVAPLLSKEEEKAQNISQWVDMDRVRTARDRFVKVWEGMFNREIEIELVNRHERLNNDTCLSVIDKRCMNETKLRETIVSQEGRAGCLVLNTRQPCAERLSKIVALQLEDSLKHSDVISQRRDMTNILDKSDRGRLDYASIMSGKVKGRAGGYRGYRIVTKGTIDGSRRTRKEIISNGVRPLSTITAPISSGYKQAKTKTGTRGVHVLYCY